MSFADLIANLTLEQAQQWERETDQMVWIIDNILDPNNFNRGRSNINTVEDRFVELLDAVAQD